MVKTIGSPPPTPFEVGAPHGNPRSATDISHLVPYFGLDMRYNWFLKSNGAAA